MSKSLLRFHALRAVVFLATLGAMFPKVALAQHGEPACGVIMDRNMTCIQGSTCAAVIQDFMPSASSSECWEWMIQKLCRGGTVGDNCAEIGEQNYVHVSTCQDGGTCDLARLLPAVEKTFASAVYATGCDGNLHIYIPDPRIYGEKAAPGAEANVHAQRASEGERL